MNLVLIQPGDEASLQAITLARALGGPVHALLIGVRRGSRPSSPSTSSTSRVTTA